MNINKAILFAGFFWCLLSFTIQNDDSFQFKKYLNDDFLGQKQTELNEDSTLFETTYLGQLDMKEGSMHTRNVSYHVLSQFYSIKAANLRHGHSRIIFLNEDGKTIRIYTLNMPEELPFDITENSLTFSSGRIRYLSLPDLFCIPDGNCYE